MSCGTISIGSSPNCSDLPTGGTKPEVGMINFDQIDSYTVDENGRITAITLIPGAQGYRFTGFRNDMKQSEEVINPGVGINQFRHLGSVVIYERTQEQKNNMERLCKGRFVFVNKLKGQDDDAIIVSGIGVGLEIVPGAIKNAHENGGFYILNFATPEGEFEPKLPQSLGTDYENAVTLFDSLFPVDSGS